MKNRPRDVEYCNVDQEKIKNAEPVLNEEIRAILEEFIVDRTDVYEKKEIIGKSFPYNDNRILQQVKFTNVRREWDRQSRYLISLIANRTDYDLKTRCFNIILFRLWNKLDSWFTLESGVLVEFPLTDEKFNQYYKTIFDLDKSGAKDGSWYSAAYNTAPVRNCHRTQLDKTNESVPFYPASPLWFAKWYLNDDLWDQIVSAKDQHELFKVLQQFPYMGGPFLAYQLFVDFTYCPDFWFSENEYTVSGPGCSRGLDLLFEDYDGMNHEEALFWLRDNQETIFSFPYDEVFGFLPPEERRINVMSFENLHCELSKYVKCVKALDRGETPRGKVGYKPKEVKPAAPKADDLFSDWT